MVEFASDQFHGIAGRSYVEGMHTVYFIKKTEQSETTLRHSAVHYSSVLRFSFHALRYRAGINHRPKIDSIP
jgi:hypothetical protein